MQVKALFRFYGGKQRLVDKILPLIPKHEVYVEPFFGGGSVFFAKDLANVNVINDLENRLITLYKIIKTNHVELEKMLDITLYSDYEFQRASNIYKGKIESTDLEMAWAVFVGFSQGIHGIPSQGWGCSTTINQAKTFRNAVKRGLKNHKDKLEQSLISCRDALRVLKYWDRPITFFYIDPPYINTDLGHYKGYTEKDYTDMLDFLSNMQGKFILSSYKNEILDDYISRFSWNFDAHYIKTHIGKNRKENIAPRMTTEILAYNYEIPSKKGLLGELIHE